MHARPWLYGCGDYSVFSRCGLCGDALPQAVFRSVVTVELDWMRTVESRLVVAESDFHGSVVFPWGDGIIRSPARSACAYAPDANDLALASSQDISRIIGAVNCIK